MPGESQQRPRAFVLMPFDADFEEVYSHLIAEPLTNAGFDVSRADSLLNQRNILADVISGIADADLVIADVTGLNPNVMYELGLAHALGKRTVMITQQISTLPFDLRPYRANEYSTNFRRAGELATLLGDVGQAVVAGTADFSNPVQDFAPAALEATAQVQQAPRATREPGTGHVRPAANDDDDDDSDGASGEIGLLDALVLVQESSERVAAVSETIGTSTTDIGDQFREGSARLDQIRKNLGSQRALQPSLVAMRDMAKNLDAYAERMIPLNVALRSALQETTTGANALARARADMPDQDIQILEDELSSLSSLGNTLVESYFGTSNFARQLAELPPMQADLTRAARRAAAVVTETASILEDAQAEFLRAESVLRERFEAARDARP